jgi:hypothetical protein
MQSISGSQTLARRVRFDPDYLQAFEAKMFIEGPRTARLLTNFFVLLLLATVIATYGVLSNSTATVIGAMIVAPQMGPIMATAAAVVMGNSRCALRSLALVAAGVASVILLALALTWIVPDVAISFTENGEIASRISPGLYALLTALGAGQPAPSSRAARRSPTRWAVWRLPSPWCRRSAWLASRWHKGRGDRLAAPCCSF